MKKMIFCVAVAALSFVLCAGCGEEQKAENIPTEPPLATATSVPTLTPSPEPTATNTPTPSPSPEPTATNMPTPSPSPEPTATPTPTPTPEPTVTPTEPPHEHVYTESITKEAACTEAGEKTFTCDCGDTYTETIEATGHNYETVTNSSAKPTCTKDGKEADTKCSRCGDTIKGKTVSATGHSYGKYTYNNDATTEKDGTETATCVCGMTDTRNKAGTKIEICPYELYVIKYDNLGFPYFYGKWGGEANMDAENLEKTDACISQMMEEIKALTICNYEYTKDGVFRSGSFTPTQDISWKFIGTYQEEKIVVRYLHNLCAVN